MRYTMLVSSSRRRKAVVFFALVLAASVTLAGRIDSDLSTTTAVLGSDKSRTASVSLIIDEEDVDLFHMPTLALPSLDDGEAQIVYTKTESITRKAQKGLEVVWKGSISDSGRIGFATLIQSSNGIAGVLDSETSAFTLSTMPDGTLLLEESFWEDAQESDSIEFDDSVGGLGGRSNVEELVSAVVADNPKSEVLSKSRGKGVQLSGPNRNLRGGDRKLEESMTVVDVLVLITNRAACESAGQSYGCELTGEIMAPIESLLAVAEEQTNTAMQTVGINASVRFVQYSFLDPSYDDFPNQEALVDLINSDTVKNMRNEFGADLVSMITGVDPTSPYLGIAHSNGPESIATYKSFQFFSMSHEMFHCMGAFHNRENSGGQHDYAHGIQVEKILRTIMSYPCSSSSCPRIPYLSAEGYDYEGTSIGDSKHNNARLVAENIASVASWKASVGQPTTPSPVASPTTAPSTAAPVTSPSTPSPVASSATAPPTEAPVTSPTAPTGTQETLPPVSPPVSPPTSPPVSPPVTPPTSSNGGEKSENSSCFSDQTTVLVQGKGGLTQMNELQIGDAVLTSNGYSKVYSFGHYDPTKLTEFLQIYTADSEQSPLEITSDHLLFIHNSLTSNTELVPADQVKVSDFLVTAHGTPNQVQLIRKIHRQGINAPFTKSGTIVVNGFAASNYIALPPSFQSHLSFEQQHWLQHQAYIPYRLFCHTVGCEPDGTDDSSGMAVGVSMWLPLLHWLERQNETALKIFLYLVAVPLASGLQLCEFMFGNVWHVIAAFLGLSCLMKHWWKGASKLQN